MENQISTTLMNLTCQMKPSFTQQYGICSIETSTHEWTYWGGIANCMHLNLLNAEHFFTWNLYESFWYVYCTSSL